MNMFIVITTLVALVLAAIAAFLPWRLWFIDKKDKIEEKVDEKRHEIASAADIKISFFSPNEADDIAICLPKDRKKEAFIVPFMVHVSNVGEEQARDIVLNIKIPELIFPLWKEGEYTYGGSAKLFGLQHHHERIGDSRIVRITLRAEFLNPQSSFVIGLETMISGQTWLSPTISALTKDKVRVRIKASMQYSFYIEAAVSTSAHVATHACHLNVIEYPTKGDPEYHLSKSDVLRGLLKGGKRAPPSYITLVQFKKREAVSLPNVPTKHRIYRLSNPTVRQMVPGASNVGAVAEVDD
jgi:hypothetical protein